LTVTTESPIQQLQAIMTRLRDPESGCPWDVKQNFDSIAPYTIEEAYEVADAIDRKNFDDLREELGDLLLQVVFHSEMAREQGRFDFDDVVRGICEKMIRRHPHVFGDADVRDAEQQTRLWEAQKRSEKNDADTSALAGIARGIPEWQRALKLQKRAATVGFDWPNVGSVFDKLHEELDEVRAELAAGSDHERLTDEIGDVLFVCVNLARHARVDVSQALRSANAKFERRFRHMEASAATRGGALSDLDLQAQDTLWDAAKRSERV
jgi:nucleoside triphosphate diphosphatase